MELTVKFFRGYLTGSGLVRLSLCSRALHRLLYNERISRALGKLVYLDVINTEVFEYLKWLYFDPVKLKRDLTLVKRPLWIEEIQWIFSALRKRIDIIRNEEQFFGVLWKLLRRLLMVRIYPAKIRELGYRIRDQYMSSLIAPGSSVGILCSQAISEPNTQGALSLFHYAGVKSKNINLGFEWFVNLLKCSTIRSKNLCTSIYLEKTVEDIRQIKDYYSEIIGTSLVDLILDKKLYCYVSPKVKDEMIRYKNKDLRYRFVKEFYGTGFNWMVRLRLDEKKMFYQGWNREKKQYSVSYCRLIREKIRSIFSEEHLVCLVRDRITLDLFVNTNGVLDMADIIADTQHNLSDEFLIETYIRNSIISALINLRISGLEGITDCRFIDSNEYLKGSKGYVIETRGVSYAETLCLPFIDARRTICNCIEETFKVLGIEAARRVIFDELQKVSTANDTYLNEKHIALLVDKMTWSGAPLPISRFGIKKEKVGPLHKATFETTMETFVNAAFFHETDNLQGVSGRIMLGMLPKVGTGYMDILMDQNMLEVPTELNYD